MKQGYCQNDIFFAPTGGEIICIGAATGNDIFPGQICKISCEASIAVPPQVTFISILMETVDDQSPPGFGVLI